MTTLFIARHGQSESNHRSLVTGQLDVGLSPTGIEQAHAIAQVLKDEPLDAIYVSALRRTAATAQPVADAKAIVPRADAKLNEIHLGELQGRHRDERDPAAQALWARWQADPWGFTVPGGEPYEDFAARVQGALHAILAAHASGRVLVVGHRATNRVLLGTLLGWPRERWAEIGPRHKHLYRVEAGAVPGISTLVLTGSKTGRVLDGLVN